MKKNLILLIIALFSVGCAKENKINEETYALAKLDNFTQDKSLYTDERLIAYPSSVTKDHRAYTKKDLDNLDYNKEVKLKDIYFRIPERCEIFKKDESYFVDFPIDPSYKVLISFKNIKVDYDLIDLSKKIIKENNLKDKLRSKPLKNKFNDIDSAYFISEDGKDRSTHFFIKGQNSTIYFLIKETNTKSGGKIMADILMTSYLAGNDPIEVRKSFKSYSNNLSVYATKKISLDGLTMKIPENFYLNQEEENLKSYLAKKDNEVIGEIIIKEDKIDGNNYDCYSLNSGDIIYPTQLINMDEVKEKNGILEGEIRLVSRENTLTGKKFVIKKDDTHQTIIIVGPLANKSLVLSMADSIRDTIER